MSNFGNVFDEWEKGDNWFPFNGGPSVTRQFVWMAFKTAGWEENYRSAIDAAIGSNGVTHYQVAGMYNAKWRDDVFADGECRRLPASETKRTLHTSEVFGLLTGKASFVSETLVPWHFDILDRDAERRDCVDCCDGCPGCSGGDVGSFPLEYCGTPDHQQFQCLGNQELPQMWRVLSVQRGFMEDYFKTMDLDDIVDGRGYLNVHGDGDDFAFGYNLKPVTVLATGLDNASLNDGAVRVEEALGLPTSGTGAYAENVTAVVPYAECHHGPTPDPPQTDVGLYLNHHQLRTGRTLTRKICSPSVPGFCSPVKFIDWLRWL